VGGFVLVGYDVRANAERCDSFPRGPAYAHGLQPSKRETTMNKKTLALLFLAVSACMPITDPAAVPPPAAAGADSHALVPTNIILVVGDGFGFSHLTTASLILDKSMRMKEMPVAGIVETRSASSLVNDSAAGASAMATGVKANNRVLSLDPAGTAHQTVLERGEALGKSTGLITTSVFWDATPAAFASHVASRYEAEEIIAQMLSSGAEFIAGAGLGKFGIEGRPAVEDVASAAGYTLVRSRAELEEARGRRTLVVLPETRHEIESPELPLATLATKAIELLAGDPEGFFLLIENEGIDGASHANVTEDVLASIRSFDAAVGVALDFAAGDGNTLVIVTADHETGGMQLYAKDGQLDIRWGTTGHTGAAVPLLAYGPGAEAFAGLLDNTDIAKRIFGYWGQ